jgi:hypothetical protein
VLQAILDARQWVMANPLSAEKIAEDEAEWEAIDNPVRK